MHQHQELALLFFNGYCSLAFKLYLNKVGYISEFRGKIAIEKGITKKL